MKNCFIFTLLLIKICSADWLHFRAFNPGLKIGYEFGEKKSWTIGIELSLTAGLPRYLVWAGIVLGVQYNLKNRFISHYEEIEFGIPFFGIALGHERRLRKSYFHCRIFNGLLGYISFKRIPKINLNQLDLVGKYPIFISTTNDRGTEYWVPFHKW